VITMTKTLKLFPIIVPCVVIALLSACGDGGSGAGTGNSGGSTSYQISATAGTGGSISPSSAMVNSGGTTTLTVAANTGYAISGATGCGGTLSGNTYTTGTISANCTVTASFVAQYTVTGSAGAGGTISPASAVVNAGGTTTLTVAANTGYVTSGVTGCGVTLSGNTYTTGAISANCTVTVNFTAAFTWVGGSNTPGASGVYGTQGIAAAVNVPGGRDGGVTWTDPSGNLWLFGGFAGYVQNLTNGDFLNDLWKYSPSSGEWTWVSGSNTIGAQGVYGAKGVAAATNVPGARSNEISWTDAGGNLWLFGGGGTDSTGTFVVFDDLWKYSPSSGEWTWVGGTNTFNATGVYGARGVAAATNMPGAREINNVVWTDAAGNIWLFGGDGYDSTGTYSRLNDLWEYSPSSGEWIWVSGSTTGNAVSGPNTGTAIGVYGTQGVAAATNVPGARLIPVTWMDATGNLWLFGGEGYDSTGSQGELNDLWAYSPSSGKWTWVGGSSTVSPTGVYGTQGVAAAANVPAGRDGAAGWKDASGNMWLFGGQGFNTSTGFYHRLNDLWKYSPTSGEWTWVEGSNTFDATGVYGTQGVAAATNVLGARSGPFRWQDISGNVWLFGGFQYDDSTNTRFEMNDLWMYPTQ
jgi:N-acetylneuraminic acid mutarotase